MNILRPLANIYVDVTTVNERISKNRDERNVSDDLSSDLTLADQYEELALAFNTSSIKLAVLYHQRADLEYFFGHDERLYSQ